MRCAVLLASMTCHLSRTHSATHIQPHAHTPGRVSEEAFAVWSTECNDCHAHRRLQLNNSNICVEDAGYIMNKITMDVMMTLSLMMPRNSRRERLSFLFQTNHRNTPAPSTHSTCLHLARQGRTYLRNLTL